MYLKNISKRKILLLIINALISLLMISCVVFLYYYLPTSPRTSKFIVEKEKSIHLTKGHYDRENMDNSRANVRILSNRRSQSMDHASQEAEDDTIYIDNENYGDEYDNSGNSANQVGDRSNEVPATVPVSIERPIERIQADEEFYYESSYDETDDEDIVSSGDGKIVVNVKKPLKNRVAQQPELVNYIENVYSVSSEIVSNLKSQYSLGDTKQINKPDKSTTDRDDLSGDDWGEEASAKGRRLSGNTEKLEERSRQLLLCESARTGELCRMLFKGTAG